MLVVLAGGFDRDRAIELLTEHLGAIEAGDRGPRTLIDYAAVPKRGAVEWDAPTTVVFVGYVPPKDPDACAALTLLSMMQWQMPLVQRPFASAVRSPMLNQVLAPVGTHPLQMTATLKPGRHVEDLVTSMTGAFDEIAGKPLQLDVLRAQLRQGLLPPAPTREMVSATARRIAQMRRIDPALAEGMVVGQGAVNLGNLILWLGPDPQGAVDRLLERDDEWWRGIVSETLDPERRFVTIVQPAGED